MHMDEDLKPDLGGLAFIDTFIGGIVFTLLVPPREGPAYSGASGRWFRAASNLPTCS